MMNIALIGYGYWGPNVAKNIYKNRKLRLHTICDKNESRLNKAKEVYLQPCNYEIDYKKVITNPEINCIAIAVETSAHYIIAKEALECGKHVYIEKPFTSTIAQAEELNSLGKKNERIIHVDHIMVYHPIIQRVKSIIESGDIGDLIYFDSMRLNLGQIKKDVSAMWDLAVHDLAIIDYITGGKVPHYINAVGEKFYNPRESLVFLTLKYDNIIAHIQSSWISPLKERRIVVAGTRKMLVYDDMKTTEKLMIYDKGVTVVSGSNMEYDDYVVKTREGDVWSPYVPQGDALFNSIEHFRLCVQCNVNSKSGPEQAIRLIRILDTADGKMNQ